MAGGRWQAVLHPRPDGFYLRLLVRIKRSPMTNKQSRLRRDAQLDPGGGVGQDPMTPRAKRGGGVGFRQSCL